MALKRNRRRYLIEDPSVYVIGTQAVHQDGLGRLLADEGFPDWKSDATTPGELIPEVAGRLCYMSFAAGRPHDEYIANLKAERHGSVLEHASITFVLTGVSRSFTHECVRHRSGWAFSQLSQRFVDEANAQFIIPWAVRRVGGDVESRWIRAIGQAHESYKDLVAALDAALLRHEPADNLKRTTSLRKLVRGAARSLLPNATETKIACTVNARALRHFLEMRASLAADHEIRAVAMAIYHEVLPFWPQLLGDYQVLHDEDGIPYLTTAFIKV